MEIFVQQIINGIFLGAGYVLIALGLTLIFGILLIPNFAHGQAYMLGAYVTFSAMTFCHFNFFFAMGASIIVIGVLGVLMERFAFRPLQHAFHLTMFIAALGVAIVLEETAHLIWGPESKIILSPVQGQLTIFSISISYFRVIILATVVIVIFALTIFIKKTKLGRAMRAIAQNRDVASLMGVNIPRISAVTFAVGSAMAGIAGSLLGVIFPIYPSMGLFPTLKAFVVIVLGGIGSIPGAIVGGLFLGIAESLGAGYISSYYKETIAFIILILALLIKPTGLFGKA